VVHLEDTSVAGAAVVGAVWFDRVALLAIAWFARRLCGERCWVCEFMGRERCVATGGRRVCGRARILEDSDCITRDGERVEDEAGQGRGLAWTWLLADSSVEVEAPVLACPFPLVGPEADAYLDPGGPRQQAVDKEQREVGQRSAATPLNPPRPALALPVKVSRR
jgi:hypothetical protein